MRVKWTFRAEIWIKEIFSKHCDRWKYMSLWFPWRLEILELKISNLNTDIEFEYLKAINQEIIRTRKFSHAQPATSNGYIKAYSIWFFFEYQAKSFWLANKATISIIIIFNKYFRAADFKLKMDEVGKSEPQVWRKLPSWKLLLVSWKSASNLKSFKDFPAHKRNFFTFYASCFFNFQCFIHEVYRTNWINPQTLKKSTVIEQIWWRICIC